MRCELYRLRPHVVMWMDSVRFSRVYLDTGLEFNLINVEILKGLKDNVKLPKQKLNRGRNAVDHGFIRDIEIHGILYKNVTFYAAQWINHSVVLSTRFMVRLKQITFEYGDSSGNLLSVGHGESS